MERWLLQVEEMMVDSVRKVLGESYAAYGDTARNMWVLEWPGQTVICTSSIYWTVEVSDALKKPSGVEVNIAEIFNSDSYTFCWWCMLTVRRVSLIIGELQ